MAWSPARALLWEYGRLAWRPVASVMLADCLLAALFHRTLAPLGTARDGIVFSSLLMTLLIVNIMALLACREDGLALGFEPRLFLLPLPTWMLVLGRLLPSLAIVAAMQLAVTFFVKQVYGMPWPVIGPTLLAMACLAWVTAILWSLGRRPYLLAPCGLALAFIGQAWLRPRLGPQKLWPELSASDTLMLLAAITLAVCVAIFGVGRARAQARHVFRLPLPGRRGDGAPAKPSGTHETIVHEGVRNRRPGFGSAIRAQLWMEWREKGRLMTFLSLGGLLVHLAFMSIPHPETTRLLQGAAFYLVFMVLIQPVIVGFLHGRTSLSSQVADLDMVRATRPLSDRHLAWTLLTAGARCLYTSWLVVLGGCAVVFLAASRWGNRAAVDALLENAQRVVANTTGFDLALLALAVVIWGWSVMAACATAALSGRNWIVLPIAIGIGSSGVAALIAERAFEFDSWSTMLPVAIAVFLVAPPIATCLAAGLAIRRRVVPWGVIVRSGCLWLALSALVVWRFPALGDSLLGGSGRPDLVSVLPWLVPAMLMLVVLPIPLAPLFMAWNRHR